ncbi:MAG: HAD-IIIA family hydrolase [Lentisphaerae bacterium]|nr:HAD-IIIA family hydrolase [Lentisphaerota bacterium]
MKSALFIDRDNTLVYDESFMSRPEQIRLLPGAAEAVKMASAYFRLYLMTNQSGIGRGFFKMEDAVACNNRMFELLDLPPPGFHGVCIAPDAPGEPVIYRKPSPRYIIETIERDGLEPELCYMIGDRITDLKSGLNAGINSILINDKTGAWDEKAQAFAEEHSISVYRSVYDAVIALLQDVPKA